MERTPDTNQTTDKIPHSGNLPGSLRETPINNYDNTPLSDAPLNKLDIQDVLPTETLSVVEKKKNKRGLLIGASAGLAGVAIVAGSIIGINAANSDAKESETPTTDPKGTSEVEPEPVAPESYLPSREDIEIEAGLDDEAFARTFIERRDSWANESNNDDLRMRRLDANLSWEEFIPIVADENTSAYAPALFGNDWKQNPEIASYVDRMTESNRGVMGNYVITAWNTENPANLEGYWIKREVTNVTRVSAEGGQRTLEIAYDNLDNNSKNSIDPYLSPGGVLTITSIVSGDVEIITSVSGHETF